MKSADTRLLTRGPWDPGPDAGPDTGGPDTGPDTGPDSD